MKHFFSTILFVCGAIFIVEAQVITDVQQYPNPLNDKRARAQFIVEKC